jgi:tetratricopeptide (TPR) repeat protein
MPTTLKLFAVSLGLLAALSPQDTTSRSRLLELRSRAYDANFRNDADQLRALAGQMAELAADATVTAAALYYAGWTDWVLFHSEFDAGRKPEASAAIQSAVERLRRLVKLTPDDAEAHALFANALVGLAFTTPNGFQTVREELFGARRRALELGPTSPRVVLLDAEMVFNTPPAVGGSQEKGLQRWLQAIDLFEAEARSEPPDALTPRWGLALAYGWMCQLYLSMEPPRVSEARRAAARALSLRPDFWYVKVRILPRLKD